jgi:hypothetical protein
MSSSISHEFLNGVVKVLAAQAQHFQATLLLLEDASETVVYKVMTTVSRVPTDGNWDGEPVLPKLVITGEHTIPTDRDAYTPVKVHVIGNVGLYQCATEAQLTSILGNAGVSAHPVVADVKIGTYEIPVESQVEYLAGQTISAAITVEVDDATEAPS